MTAADDDKFFPPLRDIVRMMIVQQLEENCVKTRVSHEGLPLPHTQPLPKAEGAEQVYKRTDAMTVDQLLFNIERVRGLAQMHTMHADAMQAHVDMLVETEGSGHGRGS